MKIYVKYVAPGTWKVHGKWSLLLGSALNGVEDQWPEMEDGQVKPEHWGLKKGWT